MQEKSTRVQALWLQQVLLSIAKPKMVFHSKTKNGRFENLGTWKWSMAIFQLLNLILSQQQLLNSRYILFTKSCLDLRKKNQKQSGCSSAWLWNRMAGQNCLQSNPVSTPTSVLCFIIFFPFVVFSSNGIWKVCVLAVKGILMSDVKTQEKWCCAKFISQAVMGSSITKSCSNGVRKYFGDCPIL